MLLDLVAAVQKGFRIASKTPDERGCDMACAACCTPRAKGRLTYGDTVSNSTTCSAGEASRFTQDRPGGWCDAVGLAPGSSRRAVGGRSRAAQAWRYPARLGL